MGVIDMMGKAFLICPKYGTNPAGVSLYRADSTHHWRKLAISKN